VALTPARERGSGASHVAGVLNRDEPTLCAQFLVCGAVMAFAVHFLKCVLLHTLPVMCVLPCTLPVMCTAVYTVCECVPLCALPAMCTAVLACLNTAAALQTLQTWSGLR